jgi:hypothetical protein
VALGFSIPVGPDPAQAGAQRTVISNNSINALLLRFLNITPSLRVIMRCNWELKESVSDVKKKIMKRCRKLAQKARNGFNQAGKSHHHNPR